MPQYHKQLRSFYWPNGFPKQLMQLKCLTFLCDLFEGPDPAETWIRHKLVLPTSPLILKTRMQFNLNDYRSVVKKGNGHLVQWDL